MNTANLKIYTRRILAIAVPIMLSNLISQLQMMIDRIFIGRLSLESMSAVGNATTPMWTTMSTIFALTTGATILVSQAYGADDLKRAGDLLSSVFKYNNVLGILLFLFWLLFPQTAFHLMGVDESIISMSIDYARYFSPIFILTGIGASISCMLEVSQKTQIMIWYGVSRSVTNVILDYVMIFGHFGFPAMGVKGAALATTIAELIGDLIVLIYVLTAKDLVLRPSRTGILHAKFASFIETVKYGIPAACEDFAWNLGSLYLIAMLNQVSVEAAGIHSIVFGVELIAVVLVGSIGTATLTLSGFETGKKNIEGVWDVVKYSGLLSFGICTFNLLLFLLFPGQILGMFTTDRSVLDIAAMYLLIVGIDLFPKSGNIIFGSGIKGYGEPSWMLKTQLIGTAFVIAGSSVLVLVFHRGILEIFILVVLDETLRFILNSRKLARIRKKHRFSGSSHEYHEDQER
ncbi:MAG: MATE family efflux transporter [Lachnospiraceae bacterium]|nr:MATE family efflux transporter [Lachnospiraceae bacterium]